MAKRKSNISLSDVLLELGFDEDGNAIEKESFSLGRYLFPETTMCNTDEIDEILDGVEIRNVETDKKEEELEITEHLPDDELIVHFEIEEIHKDAVKPLAKNSSEDVSNQNEMLQIEEIHLDTVESNVMEVLSSVLEIIEGEENQYVQQSVKCVLSCVTMRVTKMIKPNTNFRKPADIATKNHIKYPVLPRCTHNVIAGRFCEASVTEEYRDNINREYWCLSFECRRQWLDTYIDISGCVKMNVMNGNREVTLKYYMPMRYVRSFRIRVCRDMFLPTLGFRNDNTIQEFVKGKKSNDCDNSMISPKANGKGKYPRAKKFEQQIKLHINSFNPYVSHYRLKNSPHRRFLDSDLSITYMYKKYQEIYGESSASFETYRKVFDTENIGFSLPSADDCEICLEFQNHTKDSVHPPDDSAHCDICTKFPEHHKK